jgi:hypothetical protein
MRRFVYIGIFVLSFASEQTFGGNSRNSIRLFHDSIVVTSQYIENKLDSGLGYYDLKIEKTDSTKVLIGLYIKRASGLWLGLSASSDITETNIQDCYSGINAVLTYLSKNEAIEELEGMQIGIPYDIAVEVMKIYSSDEKLEKKKERIKKLILSSYYVSKLKECLKRYSLQITDISIGKIPKGTTEVELFLKISTIDHGVGPRLGGSGDGSLTHFR